MAKQYGKDSAVDFAAANLMSFGKSFSRLNGQPLDKSEIWYDDLAALKAYALTDAAYVGQKVVYVDTTANTVTHYSIELDGNLKELGTAPIGDNKSIVVNEEGIISLNKFGVEYYRLLVNGEEGYVEGQANYILQTVDADHPWKSGLVPRVLDGSIAWYEPSNITIEGLNDSIGTLQTGLTTVEQDIDKLQASVGSASGDGKDATGLFKTVEDTIVEYNTYVSNHSYTDEQIDAKVAGAFRFCGEATLEVDDGGEWTGNLVKDDSTISSPANGDVYQVGDAEYAYDGAKWIKLGFSIDLTGYATKIEVNNTKTVLQASIDSEVEARAAKDTELEGKITTVESAIEALNTSVEESIATSKAYTDSEIEKLDINKYATVEALTETNNNVSANTESINEHKTLIDAVTATANNAATKETVEAIDGRLKTVEESIATNTANISTISNDVTIIKAEQLTQDASIKKNADDLSALTQTVGTNSSDISTIKGNISSLTETVGTNTSNIAGLSTRIDTVEGTIAGQATSISDNTSAIAGNKSLIDTLTGRVDTVEGKISTLESDNNTNKLDISNLKVSVESNATKITSIEEALDIKANSADVYTKDETLEAINSAIANVDHLKREIVESLPDVANGDANTIYMILDTSVAGEDKYKEYMLINGEFACIGDTTVDLTNYVKKDDTTYTTLLNDVAALKGSEANVLESVKINGVALDIADDKSVDIPVASDTVLGVVLSSSVENKVAIAEDGTMEVNSLNVNKLVQTSGDELILNGGSSSN